MDKWHEYLIVGLICMVLGIFIGGWIQVDLVRGMQKEAVHHGCGTYNASNQFEWTHEKEGK